MPRSTSLVCLASLALATRLPAQQQQSVGSDLDQFLRSSIALDGAQRAAVERGDPVVKVLETADRRDVAVFGIVTVDMPRDAYVRRLLEFATSLAQPARSKYGLFDTPATAANLADWTMEPDDLDELEKCKPNSCNFKLPATEMSRFRELLTGSREEQTARVSAYARDRLARYVNDYRARGDSALAVYDDRGGVRASEAFRALLQESPYVYKYTPAMARYLGSYPSGTLDGARQVIYWSLDQPKRLRRTLSLNHLLVYTPPEIPDMTLLASRQLYASHYFEAAFDLTSIIERPSGGGASTRSYYVALRRYRFDNLPGGILNIRGRAIDALRDMMLADLQRQREAVRGER